VIEKTRTARRIRLLDPHVANKIAAGEVIERPASVVKELVENALDAHATRIEVFAEKGGAGLVRVVDDGWGIAREDLALAFLPHATSKLADVDDLESIATLGFRGEALASIGAVAQARIVSRVKGADAGFEIEDLGGDVGEARVAAAAPGTDVSVRNLFFNTPARARFLRTTRTELGHIEELVRRFALAFPEVATDPLSEDNPQDIYALVDLTDAARFPSNGQGGVRVPLFSDLKRHDMGAAMEESNGSPLAAVFITPRLWGVADTAPYMHDGRALNLRTAIGMHGGEGLAANQAFQALSPDRQEKLLTFLNSLRTPSRPSFDL